jgi:hypothetical protein
MWFEHTQCIIRKATSTTPNCCISDRPKSTYHSGHSASHRLAPPAHGLPPTHSASMLTASFATGIATASHLSPAGLHAPRSGASLQRTDTSMQPFVHNWPIIAPNGRVTPAQIPRRWLRDRPHFSSQYNSHSIISYTTTYPNHPDYTLLSTHPLSRSLCPSTFILLRGELCGSLPWKPPTC